MEGSTKFRRPRARDVSRWKKDCAELVSMLNKLDDSRPFREPVNLDEYPDYFEVIDTPMDLMTVRDNLEWEVYESPEDFAEDMETIFANSDTYSMHKRCEACPKTRRLAASYRIRMRRILQYYKAAIRHSEKRKTSEERENVEISRTGHNRHQETSARRSNPTQTKINDNSSTGDENPSNCSKSSSISSPWLLETDEEERINVGNTSTRSGSIVVPICPGETISESEDEHDLHRRREENETCPARETLPQKRNLVSETTEDDDRIPTVITTRSGRTVRLIAGGFRDTSPQPVKRSSRKKKPVLSERNYNNHVGHVATRGKLARKAKPEGFGASDEDEENEN